ncbi:hypothetical protein QJS10_CPB04g01866 [Acorus calamus]|uniref:Uncharacterized protein n=1 Tax=Acorus calamus TaxID=4465 RepID=A0AAV9F047_ACOCL|nr:hypothetical protein QJS10_CPB04g01866 [Acorus calamus]
MDLFSGGVTAEDAVHALIDGLLPLSEYTFSGPPSLPQKQAVARQMHAVVLLYNYYHRKQFPKLEYLDFEDFCKVSATARSNLLGHMKFMNMCGEEQDGGGLSVMEMMIMDACAVCTALDASKAAPNTEGWPVSKVVVLLIDPTKKNFLLQFCSITQGVWSPVEKRLDHTMEVAKDIKTYKKKGTTKGTLGNESPYIKDIFLKIAYSAVKENTDHSSTYFLPTISTSCLKEMMRMAHIVFTRFYHFHMMGFNEKDLRVLESHYAYSLSQAKTMARLYLMQYTKLVSEEMSEIPIIDVLSSLHGPVVRKKKNLCTLEATSVVNYFHLLPYSNILSDWISRERQFDGSLPTPDGLAKLNLIPTTGSIETYDTSCSTGQPKNSPDKDFSTAENKIFENDKMVPVVNLVNNPSSHAIKNGKHVSGNNNDDDRCAIQDGRLAGDLSLVSADFSSQQLHKLEASATKGDASLQITLIALQKKRYELELDEICYENNWILPRYNVLPSVANGKTNSRFGRSWYLHGL